MTAFGNIMITICFCMFCFVLGYLRGISDNMIFKLYKDMIERKKKNGESV